MSDREGSYGQSPLATLNMAYNINQSRVASTNQSVLAPRRPSRASYRPSLSPPPDMALPAPPSFSTASTNAFNHSQQQPIRISNQSPAVSGRSYTSSHHPYSAQSLASTPDIDQDFSDGPPLHNDRNHRNFYRSQAHSGPLQQPTGPSPNSQAQSLNFSGRQQSSSTSGSLQQTDSDLAYASNGSPVRDRMASVSPGSYFAAYPPAPGLPSRDRSDSDTSGVSAGSSSHTASANAMSPSHNPPSTPPQFNPPVTHYTPPRSSNAAQSSSHRHGASSSHRTRPSSRRALTAALELAKSAVLLDQTNDDPQGAVRAYANTVRLLGEVMDRVMRGEDHASASTASTSVTDVATEDRRRRGRRRSGVVAKEEEVRRLKAIHDTYADRLTILCLIYSIPHPSPLDRPVGGSSTSIASNQIPQIISGAAPPLSSSDLLPQQIGSNVDFSDSEQETNPFPDAPEDIHPEELPSREQEDNATIRRGYPSNGTDNEWESDSDLERTALSRDGPATRQREPETSFSAYRHQQQQQHYMPHVSQEQNAPAYVEDDFAMDTPRRLHGSGSNATPLPRSLLQEAPTPTLAPISLSAFRNSIIPPPRPPPSGPLPTRPKLASGTIIPPQLLNQPLPPLPPVPKPQPPSEPSPSPSLSPSQNTPTSTQPQPPIQTLTRQSSASSVSGLSGASSNASGSSSASNLFLPNQTVNPNNPLPNAQPPSASASLSAPSANTNLGLPSSGIPGRPRGSSNAHVRTLSNAERLVVVNEEKEEDEGTIRNSTVPAAGTGPGSTTLSYRSRSSSMVSLKDRDRAKAQILGNIGQSPLPPLPLLQKQPSAEALLEPPLPSPNTANFGAKSTPRTRGSSVGSSATQVSDDYNVNGSSPSTTPIAYMAPYTAGGAPAPGSAPIVVPGAVGNGSALESAIKLNPNTKEGTISQRRSMAASAQTMLPTVNNSQSGHGKLTSAILPAGTAASLGLTGRSRAASNPGKWIGSVISPSSTDGASRPPMPPPPMSAGPRRQFPAPSARYQPFGIPSPNGSANASTASLVPMINGAPIAGVPSSLLPPPPPALAILRPYHLMCLLRKTMTERSGGYITPRLHVPHEVWTQGHTKLANSTEKTKAVDILVAALEELANASLDFCGASNNIAASTSGGERKQGEKWASKLEEFDRVFNQEVGVSFGKKLGVGEGFVAKKSVGMAAWSSKVFEKITAATKPYDSPMAYASLLSKLFAQVQLLEEHSRVSQMSPQPPAYASLPQDVRNRIDSSLKNISELFAKVVLTFVFRDLSLMLDKYHKTCDRWIQSNPGNPP